MRKPINQVSHELGMQNQYLAYSVREGKVIGEIKNGDYHSDESWVDIDSLKQYMQWKYDNYVIGEKQLNAAMNFLNSLRQ